jgi:glycerol kinase
LPEVRDTCSKFGNFKKEIIGLSYDIPITSIIGDAQSSLIAEAAFEVGDCVITIGTGSFVSVNIGNKPISSDNGLYPLAGFKYNETEIYILHSASSSAGIDIDWAKSIGNFGQKF